MITTSAIILQSFNESLNSITINIEHEPLLPMKFPDVVLHNDKHYINSHTWINNQYLYKEATFQKI